VEFRGGCGQAATRTAGAGVRDHRWMPGWCSAPWGGAPIAVRSTVRSGGCLLVVGSGRSAGDRSGKAR